MAHSLVFLAELPRPNNGLAGQPGTRSQFIGLDKIHITRHVVGNKPTTTTTTRTIKTTMALHEMMCIYTQSGGPLQW